MTPSEGSVNQFPKHELRNFPQEYSRKNGSTFEISL